MRCANHILNLVAATDSLTAWENARYKRAYDGAMSKVQALSNAVHRSTRHADIVEEEVGLTFLNPTCTRRCSSYTAVQRVVNVGIEKGQTCQERMRQHPLTEDDMKFLDSCVKVMKPVAAPMDLLQGEGDCYIGHVVPTIKGIQHKLQLLNDKSMIPLINARNNANVSVTF